jgi:hypothetical protein
VLPGCLLAHGLELRKARTEPRKGVHRTTVIVSPLPVIVSPVFRSSEAALPRHPERSEGYTIGKGGKKKRRPIAGASGMRCFQSRLGDLGFAWLFARFRGRAPDVGKDARYILMSRPPRDDDADGLLFWSGGRDSLHIIVSLDARESCRRRPGGANGLSRRAWPPAPIIRTVDARLARRE